MGFCNKLSVFLRIFLLAGILSPLLVGCSQDEKKFNGYIDTELVYLSSDFPGRLVDLGVTKGQPVQVNQFLFRLEQTSEHYNVEMSQLNKQDLLAQQQQTLAQLQYNNINYRRILSMRKHNAASQNDLDAAKKDLDVTQQQLKEIKARIRNNQVDTADKKWQLTRKENFAPQTGIVFDTYYLPGEYVQAGNPILSLIVKSNIKAIFFVPEEQLGRLRINQKVKIATNKNPQFAKGHIFYISNIAEYTQPIIFSREERQQLVFRVEAKIDSPELEKLHIGQPITLEMIT